MKNKENIIIIIVALLFLGNIGLTIRTWFVAKQADDVALLLNKELNISGGANDPSVVQAVQTTFNYINDGVGAGYLPTPAQTKFKLDQLQATTPKK